MKILEVENEKPNFEPSYSYESKKHKPKSIMLALVVVLLLIASTQIVRKSIINSEIEKHMSLVQKIVPDNGKIITKEVQYRTAPKLNPDDTSDIFFEVINSGDCKTFVPGTLVKYNHRHKELVEIEGQTYVLIEKSVIHFHIKPEDVEKDIIKRK
mgnify:CR=1 FL=1